MEGTVFGRYRLVELMGRGGMGEVWRATDTETNNRVVAIKVLPSHLAADEMYARRFRREADAAARLNNPHIVPIHNYGEIDGRLYVDMRLIEGRDLQEVLAAGPLDPARAVRIVEQVAKALQAAHKIGLVHRDVKPSNILVDEDDFAYLIDFGIARAADETALTSTGAVIGTYHYMAPERLGAGDVDARSDIYALACVFFECLTGQRPFPGASVESQVAGHLTAPPPQPSASSPHVPADLDAVIRHGMAKNPDERFQSPVELARAARDAITVPTSRPTPVAPPVAWDAARPAASTFDATQQAAVPVPPTTASAPWWRRGKVIIPVALVSTLAIAAVIVGVTMVSGNSNPSEPAPTAQPPSAPHKSLAPPPTVSTRAAPPPVPGPTPVGAMDFAGTYTNSPSGSTWVATPCGPGCATVSSTAGWSGQARLENGQWRMQVQRADAVTCTTGEIHSGITDFTFDPENFRGTAIGTTDGPACGFAPRYTGFPSAFTLTKVG